MATTKRRLNISLSPELDTALTQIAKRDRVPEATKAAELLRDALILQEDMVWERLAEERLKSSKKWLTHDEVWK